MPPEKKKNCTFSMSPSTHAKLKSMADHTGLSMSAVLDLLVASAEIRKPDVQWHVTGKRPCDSPEVTAFRGTLLS
mgnify:CR=1 FL=1